LLNAMSITVVEQKHLDSRLEIQFELRFDHYTESRRILTPSGAG
jgi:hypothetical protein